MEYEKRGWLRELRLNYDLTQEEIVSFINIERSTYAKAELGYPVSIKTAKKIASFFNINWTKFFNHCE